MRETSLHHDLAAGKRQGAYGVAFALAGFGIWGLAPIYFKAVGHVPSVEVVAHRVVWSVLFLGGLVAIAGRWRELARDLCSAGQLGVLLATTTLLSANWLVFIWAIQNNRLLECSLGYFINPLVNVVLGVMFLGERLNARQIVAVTLASVGVSNLVWDFGAVPWVALVLAFTFGFYGLLRKRLGADARRGLFVETLLMSPVALGYLLWLAAEDAGAFGRLGSSTDLLLVAAGVVTSVPLLLFLEAARRVRLSTLGLMQYLAPTLQFLLAVLVYAEPFTRAHLVTFGCIWAALAIYTSDAIRAQRNERRPVRGKIT